MSLEDHGRTMFGEKADALFVKVEHVIFLDDKFKRYSDSDIICRMFRRSPSKTEMRVVAIRPAL